MKNPYKVLNLKQNATISEIARAMAPAMRLRKYTQREITEAQTILRKPATRLAADFTFPVIDRTHVKPLSSAVKSRKMNLDMLNENKFDSLN